MLQWFRGRLRRAGHGDRAFHALLLGVCAVSLVVLLVDPLSRAFGLPTDLRPVWILALLGLPTAWAAWRSTAVRRSSR